MLPQSTLLLLPLLLTSALTQTVDPPSFGYHGLTGPTNWYTLNKTANAKCATGRNQSPINIPTNTLTCDTNPPVISIPAQPGGVEFVNLGTTVEVELHNGTLTNGDGKVFGLRQFHFHTPSEHAVDGEYAVVEVHFVFAAEGKLLFSLFSGLRDGANV
jgi:carbonic anhydrase